jgi:hypothetical protein
MSTGAKACPRSRHPNAHDSAVPPSFLGIGIRAEKESPPALPTIGRFRVTSLHIPRKPFKVKHTGQFISVSPLGPLLLSCRMPHFTESPLLTTVQQCVINALATGVTLTDAAEANHIKPRDHLSLDENPQGILHRPAPRPR